MKKKYVAVHNLPHKTPPIDWSGHAKLLVDFACWVMLVAGMTFMVLALFK